MPYTFSIKTLGCKLNQYESSLIAHQFLNNGWASVEFGVEADVVIINTCTVTDKSDKKCRNYIRRGASSAKGGGVIVTGCLPDRDKESVLSIPGVIGAFSNKEKRELFSDILALPQYSAYDKGERTSAESEILPYGHTRGTLRIQDGCDGKCAYCIVPAVRGVPHSRSSDEVIDHARLLIDKGCRELMLTGITIGKYDYNGINFSALVESLISLPGEFRIRITSIEPKHVDERLLDLFASEKVCDHIHLPLQSGSDKVLSEMRRPYTRSEYADVVMKFKKRYPGIAVGSDLIIGFPGESEEDFLDSYNMIKDLEITHLHQFTFSPRSGTEAALRSDFCDPKVVEERCDRMRSLASELSLDYKKKFIGENLSSVIEPVPSGFNATSSNYLRIRVVNADEHRDSAGLIKDVKIISANRSEVAGEIL